MARQVEEVVIRDLYQLAAQPTQSRGSGKQPAECRRALERAQRKLRRLYELFAEGEDDTLRDAITRARRECSRAEQELERAQQAERQEEMDAAQQALQTIGSCWDKLSDAEKQTLVRACVQRIVLQNDKIEIFYVIEGAEMRQSSAG